LELRWASSSDVKKPRRAAGLLCRRMVDVALDALSSAQSDSIELYQNLTFFHVITRPHVHDLDDTIPLSVLHLHGL